MTRFDLALFTVSMDMDGDSVQVSRLEVVNTGRRRRWSVAEKLRIVEESLAGERQASRTARRHGISNSLLFKWRKAYREGRLGVAAVDGGFTRALILPEDGGLAGPLGGGRMEIVTPGGRRVIVGADVDIAALARVLAVLEGR